MDAWGCSQDGIGSRAPLDAAVGAPPHLPMQARVLSEGVAGAGGLRPSLGAEIGEIDMSLVRHRGVAGARLQRLEELGDLEQPRGSPRSREGLLEISQVALLESVSRVPLGVSPVPLGRLEGFRTQEPR